MDSLKPKATDTARNYEMGQNGVGDIKRLSVGDVDTAFELFESPQENFVYSAKEANKVRIKLDLIILPMVAQPKYQLLTRFGFSQKDKMVGTYVLNLIDKAAVSEASVFG